MDNDAVANSGTTPGSTESQEESQPERILSIQSHVVSGYVGNKAATFPLQLLGFDVDTIHSVQFSNHTGYENGFTGDRLDGTQLVSLLQGLEQNSLLQGVGHILTGYIGSASFLAAILTVVDSLRRHNPTVRYVCDPVLGDKGVFYVPRELVALYRDKVIPLAHVVTPNQFEAEQLTGVERIGDLNDARKACQVLHALGPELVVITSLELPDSPAVMTMVASQRAHDNDKKEQEAYNMYKVECPILPGHFTGTGDLCAALLLAHTTTSQTMLSLPEALERVVNTMYAVLEETHKYSGAGTTVQSRELRLVSCKRIIEDPPRRFQAGRM